MVEFPKLSLVIGGAASGKSRFAENLVGTSGHQKIYVATAQSFDAEMAAKIAKHRADRDALWRTFEAPLDLSAAFDACWQDEIILLDCLTMWLSNHLLADSDLQLEIDKLMGQLAIAKVPVVLVTNEVGASVVPENALARRFQSEQGHINQRVARHADLVVTVIAGLPMVLKGELPKGMA